MFSFTLWGRKNNDVIMMERIVDNVDCYGKQFSINSSMDMLSKYFYDMGLLQIQVHSLNVLEQGNNGKKRIKNGEEIVKQHRFIGVCNCNLRRYFVNNQFCQFEDMFPVVAGNNKLVGEIVLGIRWTNEENLNKIGALVEVQKEKRETRADNASNK